MKGRIVTIVSVLVVIAVLIIAYFAIVGQTKAAPNVGESKDPTGKKRDPIAYCTINMVCGLRKPPFSSWDGRVSSVTIQVFTWTPGAAQITVNEKFDLLGFLQSHPECWVSLRVTGPGNYLPQEFTSDHQKYTVSTETNAWTSTSFGPFVAKFWDVGSYTCTINFYRMDNDKPALMASSVQAIEVSAT